MSYKLNNYGGLVRASDGACIATDPANTDYAAYLRWLDAGNTPAQPDQPAHADLVASALAAARAQRQPIIGVLDGLQSSALAKGDAPLAQAIETAKQGLRDLTKLDLSACATYEDMRLAVKAAYYNIVVSAPEPVRIAFAGAVE